MELIEIREDPGRPSGVVLRVDGFDYPTTVAPPFEAKGEAELDWYFEEHLRFPFTDSVRARQAGERVTSYGEALFRQLIASDEAREAYGALKTRAYPDRLAIAIIGSPGFQALHWEALKDPRLPRPFALDAPMVRRRMAAAPAVEARAGDSPTLNLLVVTARPAGVYDVGYRTITRPLVGALRQAQLRVDVDFVRPGTWQALVERLEAATRDRGAGYYHAIHFDLHGALLNYADFEKRQTSPAPADRLAFRGRWGRGAIARYDGVKAFLSFEPTVGDASGLTEAGELADLLLKHRIPIVILNACQSGKQVGAEETSLGARLLEAGVQSVLAMAWSVTVSAAERLVPTLYGELFGGRPLGAAVLAGRRALHADKARRAAFNETIELEDWLLPVVYQNREAVLAFRDFTDEETKLWYAGEAGRSSEPEPEYGFVGRDLDVLRIETALLTKRNLLLVQGMGGSGKTTLLRHLAHWWELTGLVERSFYFGWDERSWTRGQILRGLAPLVLPTDVMRVFDTMNEAAQQQAVAGALRAKRHLLMLDNLESVTAAPLAIPHSLDEKQRQELRSFLGVLAGGATLVLLGSRGEEGWLAPGTFADNVYALEGLDPEAASDLADAVLRRAGAQGRREESAFKDLMALLSGYPLALQVVLPHLAAKTSAEVLDDLHQGLAEVDPEPSGDPVLARTRSLMACIDYSHGHLDPEAQALLACFAPFTGVINTNLLEPYRKALAEEPALAGLPLERLGEVLERARSLGLLQRDPTNADLLRPQPALSWFLTHRLAAVEQAERRHAIERAFRKLYDGYAASLSLLQQSKDAKARQSAQALVEQEYSNFGSTLRLALVQQSSIVGPFAVLSTHLDGLQDHRRGLELGELVLQGLERLPSNALVHNRAAELAGVFEAIATRQRLMHRFDLARSSCEKALAIFDGVKELDPHLTDIGRAHILHQLGMVLHEQRSFDEAEDAYNHARELFLAEGDRQNVANSYHQLGILAQERRRFEEAVAAHKNALKIFSELNESRGMARAYAELGTVALDQRRFDEAQAAYKIALKLFPFDDRHSAGITYNQLGKVAQKQGRLKEAEAAFKKALEIFLAFDDRHSLAKIFYDLGTVALEQGRFDEAATLSAKGLEVFQALDDRHSAARTYHQLGKGALEQGRFDEAEAASTKALDIFLAFGDQHSAASAYHQLGTVALEQRRFEKAGVAYKKALEIYLASDDSHSAASCYHELGTVALEQGHFDEAAAAYKKALKICVDFSDTDQTEFVLRSFARLSAIADAPNIPNIVATVMNLEFGEAKKLLEEYQAEM